MKIALISHLYPTNLYPHYGKFIQDQFELLNAQDDIDVDLFVPTPYSIPYSKRSEQSSSPLIKKNNNLEKVKYLSFPRKNFPKIIQTSLSTNLLKQLKKSDYDLVHLHWLYPDGLAIPSLKRMGFKTILTIHGSDWYQNTSNPILFDLIKQSLFETDRILYSGPKLKLDIEREFPELAYKSEVIYNTVDTDSYFPFSNHEKKELRKKLLWNNSKAHVLTVANIRPEKGIDLLVDTIVQSEELANIQFHIVGRPENSDFSQKVVHNIENNPFHNIDLISPMEPQELVKFYQASDFYILPSRREGFNVSILEAAACGIPVLCTDVGGNRQVIEKGVGVLIPNFKDHGAESILELFQTYQKFDPEILHQKIDADYGKKTFTNELLKNYALAIKA